MELWRAPKDPGGDGIDGKEYLNILITNHVGQNEENRRIRHRVNKL